jgi:hypothetical protein
MAGFCEHAAEHVTYIKAGIFMNNFQKQINTYTSIHANINTYIYTHTRMNKNVCARTHVFMHGHSVT